MGYKLDLAFADFSVADLCVAFLDFGNIRINRRICFVIVLGFDKLCIKAVLADGELAYMRKLRARRGNKNLLAAQGFKK